MATSVDFIEYVCEQIRDTGAVRYRKMFGEYMVYINEKPLLLVCDNTVFVKILDCTEALLKDCEKGFPYDGAKEHYMLDIEDTELSKAVITALDEALPPPKPKKKK